MIYDLVLTSRTLTPFICVGLLNRKVGATAESRLKIILEKTARKKIMRTKVHKQ